MRARLEDNDDITVDMAPLIDCVFLLLIFFLVATTLKKLDRELPVELPDAAMAIATKLDDGTLVLGVDREGQIYMGGQPVLVQQLHETLEQLGKANPEARVRIDADRLTAYQDVLHLIDQCSFFGLRRVGFHVRDNPGR